MWAFLIVAFLNEHSTELWSLRPIGGRTRGVLQKFGIFVKIKSNIAFPLVGCLTICFSVKCLRIVETGHLLKFPAASARKIGIQNPQLETQSKSNVTGYRFVDTEMLGELFTQMVCKECGKCSCLVLEDEPRERKGSASHLRVRCKDCGWVYTFYTSKKVQHSFDINKKFVYAMRSIGQGHASMKRFCSYMNMPPPLHYKAYNANNAALSKAAKSVAMKTIGRCC